MYVIFRKIDEEKNCFVFDGRVEDTHEIAFKSMTKECSAGPDEDNNLVADLYTDGGELLDVTLLSKQMRVRAQRALEAWRWDYEDDEAEPSTAAETIAGKTKPFLVGSLVAAATVPKLSTLALRARPTPTSTVGRGRAVKETLTPKLTRWSDDKINVALGDSAELCQSWPSPTVIVSDGGYGVLGFEGDTSDHLDLPQWYEPHIAAWSKRATAQTTLWFWNSEIGWAAVHPVLERYGWRYMNANIWNKGKGHVAGNVNTAKIRRFPVVSEVCVQYVFEARVNGQLLKHWLKQEWLRSGLAIRKANEACGVKDAAVRKYFDQGHLWYYPPPDMFGRLQEYANKHGKPQGRPYYSIDGKRPATVDEWAAMRSKFNCPHGVMNVWDRPALRGDERFKLNGTSGKAIHLNQKPLDLMSRIVEASSDAGDVVWEPFGGLLTGSIAAARLGRRAYGAEIDPTYFHYALERVGQEFAPPVPEKKPRRKVKTA